MEVASTVQFVSGCLVLAGAPGSGKSTMMRQAGAVPGRIVLEAPGQPDETDLPYAGLQRLTGPLLDRFPAAPDLHAAVAGREPPGGRLALGLALLDLLRAAARQQPVLVLLDDAHLLDRPTWATVAFAARRIRSFGPPHRPRRPEDPAPVVAQPRGDPIAVLAAVPAGYPPTGLPTRLLAPLDAVAARALLDRRAPGLPEEVAAALIDLAGGNPAGLTELAGSLTPAQRRGDAPPPTTLPADGALALRYRDVLAGLPADTADLLLLAATGGDLAGPDLDAAAAAAGLDPGALAPAEALGLIRATGPVLVFPEPVLRTIVYSAAPLSRRRSAHAVLAGVLAARGRPLAGLLHRARAAAGPDEDLAAQLTAAAAQAGHVAAATAHERAAELTRSPEAAAASRTAAAGHAWLAGRPRRAARLLREAAIARAAATAPATAAPARVAAEIGIRGRLDRHARETLLHEARRLAADDRPGAVDALMLAGEAFALAGEHDRYAEVAGAALALRRGAEPPELEAAFRHIAGLAALFRGDHEVAFTELRAAIRIAGRLPDPVVLNRAAMAAVLIGDGARAADLAERAVSTARLRDETALVPLGLEAAAFAGLAAGRYAEAAAAAIEGADLARATGQPPLAQTHLAILAVLAALAGDRESCRLRIREAGAQDSAEGPGQARALCEWALAVLDLVHGRPQATLDRLLTTIVAGPAGHGNVVVQVAATPHLIEAAARAAPPEPLPLDAMYAPFDAWAGHTGRPGWLALRERCRALLCTDGRAAEAHFREALRQHHAGDADFPRAHTELLFGRELRRRRRPAAAREHLRNAAETFRLLDAGPWAEQAGRELRAAGERAGPVEIRDLSAQQERIARLVAEGATNREIAEQMFLSPRTVDHHLRNVFARLGVRSRTELARRIS